ncbi:NADH-quinone oxidoreductase subunit J [Psychrobacter lutiphocae]|uniref:NADH-quinone oxidoreductase subunit J n=1 Tax=Psychrobacter lutiphocae TaxID=540500 RepID=UPI00036E77E5|nr:NADH-quinone oxidoreductase subunit J [Psychrobacter lutiphocae]
MSWLHWFDNTPLVGFYALGFVAILASLRVIMLANPVHAILSMIVSLLALAGIFFIMGAPFAGALQVIVYAGAILVLFVFVIMMLNLGVKNDERENLWLSSDTWAVPAALSFVIAVVLIYMLSLGNSYHEETVVTMVGAQTVSAKQVGTALFTEYLLLVEVAAMLLLAALVAAYHLGKKALDDENESHTSRSPNQLGSKKTLSEQMTNEGASESYDYRPVDARQFLQTKEQSVHKSQNNLHNKEES